MNARVQKLIHTSTYRSLSSHEEKVILDYLKSIPEREADEIIKIVAEKKSVITLLIAKKVLHTREYVTK